MAARTLPLEGHMVRIPTIDEIGEKRVQGGIQAYLEKDQNLRWVLGVIRNRKATALQLLLTRFRVFSKTPRHKLLREHLTPPV